jgi:hypothetical protein
MSGSPGVMMQADSGANSSGSRGSFRSVLGLSFVQPGMLLRSASKKSVSVSVTPVNAQEGDKPTSPRKHSPQGSPKHDEAKGGLLHLAMGTFGNLMSRYKTHTFVSGSLETLTKPPGQDALHVPADAPPSLCVYVSVCRVVGGGRRSVSAAPSRPLPPNGPTPTVPEETPSPSASNEPDENKTSGRLRLGAYRGAGASEGTGPPKGPMTPEQRNEGGPVDPALEALGLSGWDALEGLKKSPPDSKPKPTPAPPDPKARPSPKASTPPPVSKPAGKKAASPKQPDSNNSKPAGGLARFFGKGTSTSPTKVAPTPTPTGGKASPPPQKAQAPSSFEASKSGELENSLASTGGGDKPDKPAPPGPTTPKYLQKTAASSARTANVTPTGAGQRANMLSSSGNTPLADRARQRGD